MFKKLSLAVLILTMLLVHISSVSANFDEIRTENNHLPGHPSCADVSRDVPMTDACMALIQSRPIPNVSPIDPDFGVVQDMTFLQYTNQTLAVYDAPNGSQIDTMQTGYTYITPLQIQDGWAQISAGRWVSTASGRISYPSTYSGVTINGSLDMPFAWILWGHDATSTPAGYADRENGHYSRYQVVNIYATVHINGWDWHLIGPNHWTNQRNLSIVYPSVPANFGGRWAGVNLYEQNLVAYENNVPVMATLISSGLKNGLWDTPTGTFTIGVRLEADQMSGAEGDEDYYALDNVPYAQYFNGLISLHGTYWHNSFGYPQSHGCVNVSITDAHWLFGWLQAGDTVHVY